jgi:molybdopterin synthase catalytic subunit
LQPTPSEPAKPTNEAASDWIELTRDPLEMQAPFDFVVTPQTGAVASFAGTTRQDTDIEQGAVQSLEYEAFEEAALSRMEEIARKARENWPELVRVAILHRIGTVEVGKPSVVIAASAPHRAQALEAVSYMIDALKQSVPIWKKEKGEKGSRWANAQNLSDVPLPRPPT